MNSPDVLTLHPGYLCECWTQSPATGGRPAVVAGFPFRAATASEAVRWIRGVVRTVALSLDPDEVEGALSWIRSGYIDDIEALNRNQPCAVDISYADTRIRWTVRPVVFLPMVDLVIA
ncbi:hypothetical protein [Streptacidiphilus cavernicola]|uniref:hypothetical protein n=1 Tax=Streptacidiphilus cavernicola TaxID=3342716 RepID=UPI0005663D93